MNINFRDLVPRDFNDNSHVWIYQSNRVFNVYDAHDIQKLLQNFAKGWKSKGIPLKCYGNLFFGQFIIFMADEATTGMSSSCIDSSLKLIKNIEQDFRVELFDRLMLAFIIKERIQLLPLTKLNSAIETYVITPDTLYFNNTILTKKELLNNWIIPIKESWLATRFHETGSLKTSRN